jgi:hypothetical protein
MKELPRVGKKPHGLPWFLYRGQSGLERGMHKATSRKVAGSRPDEVNKLFLIYIILPAALGPGVYSDPNRNEWQRQKNVSG